jgi:hypothetical protein
MPAIGEEELIPFLIGSLGATSSAGAGRPTAPHFGWPFGRGAGGKVSTVEQDSPEHVLACSQVIARCQLGARPERPEFGWRQPYMRMLPIDTTDLIAALKRFEPRSEPLAAQPEAAQALALLAVGSAELDVDVGTTNADPTGVGRGVND